MRHNDIHWIMTRYNHDDPHMWMSTSHVAKLIGKETEWTRVELGKMVKIGMIKVKKQGHLLWSAI